MNSNGNMVKKEKQESIVEEEEDIELDDDNDDKKDSKPMKVNFDLSSKKKMLMLMGIIVGATLLLLLILYIMSLSSNKSYSYEKIEKVLTDAAKSYFKDYPDNLPANDGDVVEIDSSNLVVAGKMKDLSEYTNSGVMCSGSVQVEKSGDDYLYAPFLNCGDSYVTTELYKKVIDDDNVVSSGDGVYLKNGEYYYRGEHVNNYVQLENNLWRIIKVTSNNNIVLISSDIIPYSNHSWDDRYNSTLDYTAGINSYKLSRIREKLDNIYSNNEDKEDSKERIFSKNDKTMLVSYNLCIGKRTIDSGVNDNSIECKETLSNEKVGLLTLSDYLYASLDSECKKASSQACSNYNYLVSTSNDWWLVTASEKDTSMVFNVSRSGFVKEKRASSYSYIRPVIYLNNKILYKAGDGTLEKPFTVR